VTVSVRDARTSATDRQWIESVYRDYLDDLSPQRAPFRLVPRSHLSFHADANPYARYHSHPEEVSLVVPAGSAVVQP
jgi:hypothetical protein